MRKLLLLFLLIILSIISFEIGYRVLPKKMIHGLDYNFVYSDNGLNEGGFLKPNIDTLLVGYENDKIRWITNSKGFRNSKDFLKDKNENTIRILSLGDSFTAGLRINQNKTFSKLLEKQLNQNIDSLDFEILIANIEHTRNGIEYLKKYGFSYKPDFVLLGVTLGNDLTQSYLSLIKKEFSNVEYENLLNSNLPGYACDFSFELDDYFEKLVSVKLLKNLFGIQKDGNSIFAMQGKANPKMFDLSHGLSIFLTDQPSNIKTTYRYFEETLLNIDSTCKKNKTELIVCLFPQRYQINEKDWQKTIKHYDLIEDAFDLDKPNNILQEIGFKNSLNIIDLTPYLKSEFEAKQEQLYMPYGDMHWNEKGNEIVAKYLYEHLSNALVSVEF